MWRFGLLHTTRARVTGRAQKSRNIQESGFQLELDQIQGKGDED
jgi:hypothetical protein